MSRVLITRAVEDAESLAAPLRAAGHEPVLVPLMERRPLPLELPDALFDWLLLTSPATVPLLPRRSLARRVAAVGSATAEAARQHGLVVDLVPHTYTGADLVEALHLRPGDRVLYPHAAHATASTREALDATGAEVVSVVVYDNRCPDDAAERLAAAMPVDIITLLSASAARRLAQLASDLGAARVVTIGPSTTAAAQSAGLTVFAEAKPHTVEGLVAAVLAATK